MVTDTCFSQYRPECEIGNAFSKKCVTQLSINPKSQIWYGFVSRVTQRFDWESEKREIFVLQIPSVGVHTIFTHSLSPRKRYGLETRDRLRRQSFRLSGRMRVLRARSRILGFAFGSDQDGAFDDGKPHRWRGNHRRWTPRVWATSRDRSASGVRALGCRRREASAARRPASIVEARVPLRSSNPYNPRRATHSCTHTS